MKNDTIMRFAFIETRVYWGEGLTAGQLATAFGLSRPYAQTVIDKYCQRYPGALQFDARRRRQVAGAGFEPHYIHTGPTRFLDHVRAQNLSAYYLENPVWSEIPFEDVERLLTHRLTHKPLQAVFQGLYEQKAVILHYRAKTGAKLREVSPHHLVYADNRYHLRGRCHMTGQYPDFNLARILHSELSTAPWYSARDDKEWNIMETLYFQLNPQLPSEAKNALRCDYLLDDTDSFEIRCRQAVSKYVRRHLLAIDENLQMQRWLEYELPSS